MRVLHVIESMGRGGAERNMASLLRPLAALGVQNQLVTLWPGRSYEDRVAPYVQRHELNLRHGRALAGLPRLMRLAREVDVVHTQLTWANIMGRLAAVSGARPSVTTLHTTAYDESNLVRLPAAIQFKVRAIRQIDSATARTTEHFFAVSPAVKDVHVKTLGIPPEQVEIAPCCVDLDEFNPDEMDRSVARAELGFTAGEFAVLSVGRLIWSKRHCDAIEAVAVAARDTSIRLYIAGAGPEETALRALAESQGAPVTFLGVRDDIPRLLRAADLFLFPSVYEGMPVSLLEAMAMGLPCLCSDIVENRMLGGDAPRYFAPGDAVHLAKELAALVVDPDRLERMGEAGRQRALPFADPELAAARFVKSVRAVLERRAANGTS